MLGYNYIFALCDCRRDDLNAASTDHTLDPSAAPRPRCVHTITDRFSMANTFLIDDEHLVVVDPGSRLNVQLLCKYVQSFLGRSPSDIDLIVLTHLHPDHTAGVQELRSICNAPVAASAVIRQLAQKEMHIGKVRPRISHFAGQMLLGPLQHFDLFPPAYTQQMKFIDIWLDDVAGLPLHPDWRVIASPGHTPESLCLYQPFTQELLCGDTVITLEGGAPLLRSGSNRQQLEETLRVLRTLRVHYLYPGHGRPILGRHPLSNADVEW
jgi:hydroxyacylglutathione hydrolase